MDKLVAFESEEGGEVLVEVQEHAFGVERVAREGEDFVRASKKLETTLTTIRPAARAVLGALADLGTDEKQVQFGVKLNSEAGALIARAGGECHFQITLMWKDRQTGGAS